MNGKKKSAISVATTESGSGNNITKDIFDYSTKRMKEQGIVEKYLKKGAENAISGKALVNMIGCRSTRQLQLLVSKERQHGALILSSEEGYYLPSDGMKGREELTRFIATYRSMALSTLKVLNAAKKALAIADGQIEVDEILCQNDLG